MLLDCVGLRFRLLVVNSGTQTEQEIERALYADFRDGFRRINDRHINCVFLDYSVDLSDLCGRHVFHTKDSNREHHGGRYVNRVARNVSDSFLTSP